LLAEHRELHGLWNILTKHDAKGGYSHYPETLRWVGKQKALYLRHEALVKEFTRREYKYYTSIDKRFATGIVSQRVLINTISEQENFPGKNRVNVYCVFNSGRVKGGLKICLKDRCEGI